MEKQKLNLRFGVLAAFILVVAFSRIIPHIPNFSPLEAIGLFGAAYFTKKWQAFLVPIMTTWLSDLWSILSNIHLVLSRILLAIWQLSFNNIGNRSTAADRCTSL